MTSPNICFTTSKTDNRFPTLWSPKVEATLERLGFELRLNEFDKNTETEEWAEFFRGADAIVTSWMSPKISPETLKYNDNLKFVGHAAGSVATLMAPEIFERGVRLSTCNPIMAASVARYCIMMTMVAQRYLHQCAQFSPERTAQRQPRKNPSDSQDWTIGVWGFGDVARQFIELAKVNFEPKEITVADDWMTGEMAAKAGVRKVDLDMLFAESDVIHTLQSLTDKSIGAVGAKQLQSIKDDAILVNAGRAHLIQEEPFLEELSKDRFTVALDVNHTEPVPDDSPLRKMRNVMITPHIGGKASRSRYVPSMLEEFDRLLKGEPLKHEVTADRAATMTSKNLVSAERRKKREAKAG